MERVTEPRGRVLSEAEDRAYKTIARHKLCRFEPDGWVEAIAFCCAGGLALVGWFRDERGKFAVQRLVGYDRSALLRAARSFGVVCATIQDGAGSGAPYVELWGRPASRALKAAAEWPW